MSTAQRIKLRQLQKQLQNTQDGMGNLMVSMGSGTKDKARNFTFNPDDKLDFNTLDYLYAQNGMVKKIVNIIADDMVREGIDFISTNSKIFLDEYKRLNIFPEVNKALRYSVLHGGGIIFLLINDGRDYSEPIDYKNIKSIDGLITLDCNYLTPDGGYKAFTKVDRWVLNSPYNNNITAGQVIHESRLLIFDGEDCGERLRQRNRGHGESFIWCIKEAIENYDICHNVAPSLLIELSQGVYKIKNLNSAFSMKSNTAQDALVSRMGIVSSMQSNNNKICIDKEEDYMKVDTNLTNVDLVIQQAERRLCANADIPHSRLLSESSGASLGESGTGEKRDHYDNIKSKQETKLRPCLDKLNKIIASLKKTNEPEYVFNILMQSSESEMAKIKKLISEVDVTYLEMGLPVQDIFTSRFADNRYSTNIFWNGKINPPIVTRTKNAIENNNDVPPVDKNNMVQVPNITKGKK